jgi:DNA-binding NarL/FixJ family response regulator
MKILLVEDHSIVRYGIVRILTSLSSDVSIAECGDFDEALRLIDKERFNLVILDINIPNGSNLQMIHLLRHKQDDIKILIFSGSDERLYALHYLREGADGYLMKDSPNQEIIDAVRCIMNNEQYISANIKRQLLKNLHHKVHANEDFISSLSEREVEVMQHLIDGESIGEIARVMNLHVSTVSTYKTRIYKKFEVNNVIDLAKKRQMLSN